MKLLAVLLLAGSLSLPAATPMAATRTWVAAGSGNWSDAASWSGGSTPGPADDAVIGGLADVTVTLDVSAAITHLTLGGSAGTQVLVVSGPTLTLTAPGLIGTRGLLRVQAGSLAGAGNVDVAGRVEWTGGSLVGPSSLNVLEAGALSISGPAPKSLSDHRRIRSDGAITWEGGPVDVSQGSGFETLAHGSLTTNGDEDLSEADDEAETDLQELTNYGTFVKAGGAGRKSIKTKFRNRGRLEVQEGVLSFSKPLLQEAGETLLEGGDIEAGRGFTITGGRLGGNGRVVGNVTNGGTLAPGNSPGTLDITGNLVEQPTATYSVQIAGTEPVSKYDVMVVGGTATLDGTLAVTTTDGFVPQPGDKFAVLTAQDVQGAFATTTGTQIDSKLSLVVDTSAGGVTLVAPVLIELGDVSVGGGVTDAALPITLEAGSACVAHFEAVASLSPGLTLGALDVAGACAVAVLPDRDGVRLTADCPGGVSGTVGLGALHVQLPGQGLDSATFPVAGGTASALDCGLLPKGVLASVVGGTVSAGCVGGDVFPDGIGDGRLSLADFVLARRKLSHVVPLLPRDVLCADLSPGTVTCQPPGAAGSWCPTGDDALGLADIVTLRRLVAHALVQGCGGCGASQALHAASPIPGDVAPRGSPDGRVDVADVVALLAASTGTTDSSGMRLQADIAPTIREGALTVARGDGRIDVSDVVVALRASVGLLQLAWPERMLEAELPAGEGMQVTFAGWPSTAAPTAIEHAACSDDDVDVVGDRLIVTCATDEPFAASTLRVRYRSPLPVSPESLQASAVVLGAGLEETALPVALR